MGSLLPDSNSRSGLMSPFKPTLRARSTANTAAASVDETIAPSSKPSSREKPSTPAPNAPTSAAVTTTPSVESARARPTTGRTLSHAVSSPPAKRMKTSATTPKMRDERIIEWNPADAFRSGKHSDTEKDQERRHAETARRRRESGSPRIIKNR